MNRKYFSTKVRNVHETSANSEAHGMPPLASWQRGGGMSTILGYWKIVEIFFLVRKFSSKIPKNLKSLH